MTDKNPPKLTYTQINDDVLAPLKMPRLLYFGIMAVLASGIVWAGVCWLYQAKMGMRVTGLSIPVGWAFYITNFVFWVGIGHAGTLISAILHLVRSRWRTAVSRSAEAMTVFAVMTAALFPLVHLGRVWVFYYIIPYPSQRQLWPNFVSPLVWDVCAVGTYLTVSTIFWLVGLVPDVAAARDRCTELLGENHSRTRLYRLMALGWTGSSLQWHHFGRAYLFFAALATPLVISVHSVVSWDFAMANLPGWHTTIFAPYFVAGAIHSGLAMVLVLLIPMRRLLHLERLIRMEHFDAMAKTMIATALIVGYTYLIEPLIALYSGDIFETQFAAYRATGWFAIFYWALIVLNVLVPLVFLFQAARRNIKTLFIVGILVNVGMWLERWVIIAGSLSHDFLPHNWFTYAPRPVEISITIGAFAFFLFWFFGFSRLFPTVAASDVKELTAGLLYVPESESTEPLKPARELNIKESGVVAVFASHEVLLAAMKKLKTASFDHMEFFSPFKIDEAAVMIGRRKNPVRFWTLIGALSGCIGGFWLAIGSAAVNNLIVGGKFTPAAYIPYCIVGFEGTILLGTLANLAGMLFHSRLGRLQLPAGYNRRFTQDRFGLLVKCTLQQVDEVKILLSSSNAEEINVIR
jgi:Ni/Fe-hydrogenase subunit HybB-like protein